MRSVEREPVFQRLRDGTDAGFESKLQELPLRLAARRLGKARREPLTKSRRYVRPTDRLALPLSVARHR